MHVANVGEFQAYLCGAHHAVTFQFVIAQLSCILQYLIHIVGLCIPSNNTIFIKSVSERLAANEPHLTLEFLEECIQGFRASNIEMKHLCLEYMTPWLPNLTRSEF